MSLTPNDYYRPDPASGARYRLAITTAAMAAVFSLVVIAALLWHYGRRVAKDPMEAPAFLQLKVDLHAAVADQTLAPEAKAKRVESLKEEIRRLDLLLRQEYFRQRWLAQTGAYLLLVGLLVALLAARWAAHLRPRLPSPSLQTSPQESEAANKRLAWRATAVLAAMIAAVGLFLAGGFQSHLPQSPEEIAALSTSPQAAAPASGPVEPTGSEGVAAADDFASDEEMADNWPRFRGPGGLGISTAKGVPIVWNAESGEGILWKAEVPLPGNNSPIVWGDRIFLSGADAQRRQVYCFAADDGKLLWQRDVPGGPGSNEPLKIMDDTGYAAPTMATDGRRVMASFANGDLACFDLDGNLLWSRGLGVPKNDYGHAASLSTHKGLLLVQFDQGSDRDKLSKMLGLDSRSGKTVWETDRPVPHSWTTPIVIHHGGRDQVITSADPWVIAYDPAGGGELWRANCLRNDVGPSPVFAAGLVFAVNEYSKLSAIRADGTGDVTETHVAWTAEEGLPDTSSPMATDKYVYLTESTGILTCYSADGEHLWEQEFDAEFWSSPTLIDNRLYLFGKEGDCWVVEPGQDGCKVLQQNTLGEHCVTSPAVSGGRMFIRGQEHLFSIGTK